MPVSTRIRFVSDLHLGHSKSSIQDPRQIEFLLEDCDKLVVCGDFAEEKHPEFSQRAMSMIKQFQDLCDLHNVDLLLLAGNHDPERLLNAWQGLDGRLIAFHGHCLFKQVSPWSLEYLLHKEHIQQQIAKFERETHGTDPLCKRLELARFVSQLLKPQPFRKSQRFWWQRSKLYQFIQYVCYPPERPFRILQAWLCMKQNICNFCEVYCPSVQVVCYGHFHRRHVFESRGRIYINLGAFFEHATSYAVDLHGYDLRVREVSVDGWGGNVRQINLEPL